MLSLIQIIFGWYAADLLTGIYHYFIDNYGSPKTPIFGKQIEEFQLHHRKPTEFLKNDAWTSLKLPLLGSLPFILLSFFNPYFFLPLAIGIAFSQWFHKWSHQVNPWYISIFQKTGIILPYDEHRKHHISFDRYYCIVNGWGNGLLDLILDLLRPWGFR